MTAPTPKPFFVYPWCVDGTDGTDIISINNAGVDSGTVNYQYGWTPNYELDSTDPSSLPVPRQQMNQVLFDITSALQQLQLYGFSLWVASASGGPGSYSKNAYVAYNTGSPDYTQIWISQIDSNTSTPGADDNWVAITGNAQGIPVGSMIDYGGVTEPSGWFAMTGTTKSRTTYSNLYNAITQVQSCTTTNTSTTVTVTDSSTLFAGMPIEGSGIPSSTTVATIVDGTTITISNAATASASPDCRFFQWGNGDGSTTFTLPDTRRRVSIGAGGTGSSTPYGVAGTNVGETGGEESHTQTQAELATHTHTVVNSPNNFFNNNGASIQFLAGSTPFQQEAITLNNTGSSTAFNVMQPSYIAYKIIKY